MSINVCNNNSLSAITSIPDSITGSALNLISTQTASSSSTISFTSGIDSTYKEYIFKFINIHPSGTNRFQFNGSIDSGSNYNVTKTTTFFRAQHRESDDVAELAYDAGLDLAQGTGIQQLGFEMGNGNDDNFNGTLHLFDPSNTTFVKHFISRNSFNHNVADPRAMDAFIGGYGNTTSAVNAVRFQMSGGNNIDSGTIKLYGVS